MPATLRVLALGPGPRPEDGAWGSFTLTECGDLGDLVARLRAESADAVLWCADALAQWPDLPIVAVDMPVVILAVSATPSLAIDAAQAGAQDVLPVQASGAMVARALRLALERKRLERAARNAFATDLSTGLPNRAQLVEHMTHLLALREREPAPMALVVVRLEGLGMAAGVLGPEAPNVLRRKAAVRLRSGLRASDVVASIGADAFAVLLAWIDAPADGERVMRKLASALAQPFSVTGREQTLAVRAGLASYPEHGKDADSLLRRALGQAASVATMGRAGLASAADRGPAAAANDDDLA